MVKSSTQSARYFVNRFVAFVDILGFRDIVRRMPGDRDLFRTFRDALKDLDRQTERFRKYQATLPQRRQATIAKGIVPLSIPTDLQMTAFSDCYVLSETFPAWHVLAAVQSLGSRFLKNGVLTRGAVVHGQTYHRGRVLFGPAVIEAYEIESQVAKYPRILVTEAVRKAGWGYHEGMCRGKLFCKDIDGCWFINVLRPPISNWGALPTRSTERDLGAFLRNVRGVLMLKRSQTGGDLASASKVSWLIHRFNEVAAMEGVELIDV